MTNTKLWDPYADFEKSVLPNGLTVYAAHWPNRSWQSFGFLVHSGAEYDPIGLEGTAHFVEHLVSENASISSDEIIDMFDTYGGSVKLGTTSYSSTHYQCFGPADPIFTAKALNIFGGMLLDARLEKEVERERSVIIQEYYERYGSEVFADIQAKINKTVHGNDWPGRFITSLGRIDSINRISVMDLQSYYDTHYTPANMTIVTLGSMSLDTVVQVISESRFGQNKPGLRMSFPDAASVIYPPSNDHPSKLNLSELISKKVGVNVNGYELIAKLPKSIDVFSVMVFRRLIHKSLFKKLREERAWVYSVNANYTDWRHLYTFGISCRKFPNEAMNHIKAVVDECLESVSKDEKQFNKMKQLVMASRKLLDTDSNQLITDIFSDLSLRNKLTTLHEDIDDINNVSMKDIQRIIEWFSAERRFSLITH